MNERLDIHMNGDEDDHHESNREWGLKITESKEYEYKQEGCIYVAREDWYRQGEWRWWWWLWWLYDGGWFDGWMFQIKWDEH